MSETDPYETMPLTMQWAAHLARDRRRSAHTVRAYRASAERLVAFLQAHWGERPTAAALARMSAADLRAFLAARRGEGLGNASAARELSAVRNPIYSLAPIHVSSKRGPHEATVNAILKAIGR
jgi:integrase/recombinase XerC